MCAQIDVLHKIRAKGKVNGYDVDLAEAQAKDYMTMKRRIETIESDVSEIKKSQIEQNAKLDLILKYIESPAEAERKAGQKWNLIASIARHKSAWVILTLVLIAFALAGDRMAHLLGDIIRKTIGG